MLSCLKFVGSPQRGQCPRARGRAGTRVELLLIASGRTGAAMEECAGGGWQRSLTRKGADPRRVAAATEQAAAAVARVLHAADADGPAAHSSRCSSL